MVNLTADFRGAESKLFKKAWFNLPAVFKVRIPKAYRIKELDDYFRKQRTIHEARLLIKAKAAGVRVPIIYEIDLQNATLILEFINGEILKTALPKMTMEERKRTCHQLGEDIGRLHAKGIIHGDLTTSNIIKIDTKKQIGFIDFGLGFFSDKEEDFGVDFYLFKKAMENTHAEFFAEAWPEIVDGYKKTAPFGKTIEKKMKEIASRGRYSERI